MSPAEHSKSQSRFQFSPFLFYLYSGSRWEDAFLDNVGRAENSDLFKAIRVSMFASRTLDIELEKNTQSVVPYIAITFIAMAVFSVLSSMMMDQVRSKPMMGLLGNLSAIMATCAAFGLAMYGGIEFIGINLAAPFLMISELQFRDDICV